MKVFKLYASRSVLDYNQPWISGKITNTIGTCFVFNDKIVTCAHNVIGSFGISYENFCPREQHNTEPIFVSDELDVATLTLESEKQKVEVCEDIKFTEPVYVTGFGGTDKYVKTLQGNITNMVVGLYPSGLQNIMFRTSISVEPGYSGSPVTNSKGQLIGICCAASEKNSFIIPVSYLLVHLKLTSINSKACCFYQSDINTGDTKFSGITMHGILYPYWHAARLSLPGEKTDLGTVSLTAKPISGLPKTIKDICADYLILDNHVFVPLNGYIIFTAFMSCPPKDKPQVVLIWSSISHNSENFIKNLLVVSINDKEISTLAELYKEYKAGARHLKFENGSPMTLGNTNPEKIEKIIGHPHFKIHDF